MAFSINEVIHIACLSRSWFVLHTPEQIKQTNYVTDQRRKWLPKQFGHAREKPLLTGRLLQDLH